MERIHDKTGSPSTDESWNSFLKYGGVCFVIYFGIFLHAVNVFITTTALPSIVREIGGGEFINWVTTTYILMTIVISLVGLPLVRAIGVQKVLIAGCLTYVIGNGVCAESDAMMVFLLGRLIQGVGSGTLLVVSYSLIGTSLSERLRAKAFALVGCIWSGAMLIGPSIGGLLTEYVSWRAAFLSMVVATILYLGGVLFLRLPFDKRNYGREPNNGFHLFLFAFGVVCCVSLIMLTNRFDDMLIGGMTTALALIALYILITIYRRERFGFLHPEILRFDGQIGLASWILFLLSASTYSFSIYGAILSQNIFGLSVTVAGYLVGGYALAMTLGEVVIANASKSRRESLLTISQFLILIGLCGIGFSLRGDTLLWLLISVTVAGFGCGFSWTAVSELISQNAEGQIGRSAASSIPSIQMLGVAVGSALYGSIANTFGFDETSTIEISKEFSMLVHVLPATIVCLAVVAAIRISALRVKHSFSQHENYHSEKI